MKRLDRGSLALLSLGLAIVAAGGATLAVTGGPTPRSAPSPGLAEAKALFANRKYLEAGRLLRAIPDPEARLLLGRTLVERGRLAEAREIFSDALKSDPLNVEALRGLAAAIRGLGQKDMAALLYRRAADADPKNPLAWKELGLCQRENGDAMGALASLQQSLALDRDQADLIALLSELATAPSAAPRFPAVDPMTPRPIDPAALSPRPGAPDPTRHFPKPGGTPR